ncbi:MAG: hypothetical protein PCFJNLEI_00120 [Verrucomicrobiae bacterium]|nr:hypothetical protein [Verrucomicrobiae bacterium]
MQDRPLATIESPWNHRAKRFIEAPVCRLCPPHPQAQFWRLELRQDDWQPVIENNAPILDTLAVWPQLRFGSWIFARVCEYDRPGGTCLARHPFGAFPNVDGYGKFAKAPDWDDHTEPPVDYAASVRRNAEWFDSLETHPRVTYREPGMPAWWWHAAEGGDPVHGQFLPGAFPALGAGGIRSLLLTAKVFPDRAARDRQTARAIGDWLLRNHTPLTGVLPGMPYTAMREGKFEYSASGGALNVSRGALPGAMLTWLYRDTGERKYLEYAEHIAGVLVKFIRADGSMPYRVEPVTGTVVEEYTCGHLLVALFLEMLDRVAPNGRWRESADRIIEWALAKPMRDFNWKGCYEDVQDLPPFSNLTGMDALWAVRLFCRRGAVAPARQLLRWVEDQFVNFGDEISAKVETFYPVVREQWFCDFPMEGHSANYASACGELFRVTGDGVYRRKQIATLNAIVKAQRSDGAYSTWGVDRHTGRRLVGIGGEGTWFNANHHATSELCSFVLRDRGEELLQL